MKQVFFDNEDNGFYESVKTAVDAYFIQHRLKKTGNMKLYIKTAIFIPLSLLTYFYLLFGHYSVVAGTGFSLILGLLLSLIAINIMHDACHGSFSQKKWINSIMGLTMNALGSNAFLWKIKHNIIHHTYTNIEGIDNDIAQWPVLRQSPYQPWIPLHRFQYLYMFPLYAISTLVWMLVADFSKYFSGRISSTAIKRINIKEHLLFWVSKLLYCIFYIMIPIILVGWQSWLTGFLLIHFTMGFTLTIIFQLAHLVCNTHFEPAGAVLKKIKNCWAVHEVRTTSNFATGNYWVSWFLGGLNFQVEHHLFPRISHVHYPAISNIIREECVRHHLPYHCYTSVGKAFLSHVRFMKMLGKYDKPNAAALQ
jgi:linoleoyl-CoA desaturase